MLGRIFPQTLSPTCNQSQTSMKGKDYPALVFRCALLHTLVRLRSSSTSIASPLSTAQKNTKTKEMESRKVEIVELINPQWLFSGFPPLSDQQSPALQLYWLLHSE
ncbi:uncharacterized [Tachysurus ichikawai]